MEYKFNDAVMLKKEVQFEYNRIMFFIINNKGKVLLTCKDSRYSFPFFDVKKDSTYEETLNKINKEILHNKLDLNSIPFVKITDYQYRYPVNDFKYNNLVHIKCYLINDTNNEIYIDNGFSMHLFEIQDYLDNLKDNDYYHYDNRIIDTILNEYISNNSEMFFDPKNYKNYLMNRYHSKEDDDLRSAYRRKKYIEQFVGDTIIKDICTDSKEFIQNLFENVKFVNDNYVSIPLQYVNGLKNSNDDFYADIIATYDNHGEEKNLSLYILKNILGSSFNLYLTNQNEEYKDDEGNIIGDYIGLPIIYIKGDVNKLLDVAIREEDTSKLVLKK